MRVGTTNRTDERGCRPRRGCHFEVRGKHIDINIRQKSEHGADKRSEFIPKKLQVCEDVDRDRVGARSPLVIYKVETSVVKDVVTRFQLSQP